MRIVDKKEFYTLPKGTLFAKYDPVCFDGLYVKERTLYFEDNEPVDYTYSSILGNVDCESSADFMKILDNSQEKKTSFKLDFNCTERDGLYESSEFFAIYEEEDVVNFIHKLELVRESFVELKK